MLKSHYILLVAAFLLIAGLSFLPKTVVKNPDKAVKGSEKANVEKEATASPAKEPPKEADITAMHNTALNEKQQKDLARLQQKFESAAQEKDKAVWLDSCIVLLQSANKYDTAAILAENFASKYNTLPNLMRAGDAYYGALQFSMNEKKAQELGEKARKYFQQVVDKDANFSEAKVKLGLTYVASPTPMQGILLIREVLKEEPENVFAIMSLGKLSIQSNQYDKAVDRFRQVLGLQPDNVEAKFLLAVSLGESGKKTEAVALLKELKNSSKDPAVLMQTESYLKQLEEK
jgi:predicted Zn-dependent protease